MCTSAHCIVSNSMYTVVVDALTKEEEEKIICKYTFVLVRPHVFIGTGHACEALDKYLQ